MVGIKYVLTLSSVSLFWSYRNKIVVRSSDGSGFIIGELALDFRILGVWYGNDKYHWATEVVSRDSSGFFLSARGQCTSEGSNYWIFPLTMSVLHFSFLVSANVLAYQTRNYHKISDSRMVAIICLFNSTQLLLVATVVLVFSNESGLSHIWCAPAMYS
jgi:hypothetical protein